MEISKIPCIDCITLPICKSIALEPFWRGVNDIVLISELSKKCKLMSDYVNSIGYSDTFHGQIKKLHIFFKTSQVTNKKLNNGT